MTENSIKKAHDVCLRLLAVRSRTTHELETALTTRGCSSEVIRATLARLESYGLVDDETFARAWVQSRAQGKGLSRQMLRHELVRKGVDKQTVDEVLADVTPADELEAAVRLVRRRLGRLSTSPDDAQCRRMTALLARRGYSQRQAREALTRALSSAEEAEDCG